MLIPSWSFNSTVLKEMNNLPQLTWIFIGNWAAVSYSCSWFYPAADQISRGWIEIVADSILQPSRVPVAGYKLRLSRVLSVGYKLWLTPFYGSLECPRQDTGCDRLHPMADLSSSGWVRGTADYILQLTRVASAGYDLRLILSCGWLRVVADSILRSTQVRRLD